MSADPITQTTGLGELTKAMAWVDDVEPSEIAVEIASLRTLLREALQTLQWARVFVTSRERAKHPEGTRLYDEAILKLEAAL